MKRIITAIGNENLNNKLRNIDDVEVKERDIYYKEGILEYLEQDSDVDIIIINEVLLNDELELYMEKINKYEIQIFLIVNKKHYMEEFDNYKDVRLFKVENDIIQLLKNNFEDCDNCSYNFSNEKRVISILGNYGVGKTVFCSLLGKVLSKNNKVLLINFDIFSDNLKYLFDLKNGIQSYDVSSLINKASKNLYVLNGLKYVFNEENKIDSFKVKELLDNLKKTFEYILIDTTSEVSLKFIKTIFPNCDYNLFLVEANYLELKKAEELLEIYTLDFGLLKEKTGIFINKYNISSIDEDIIRNIFSEFDYLGKIKYSPQINSYINTFTRNNVKIDDITKFKKYLKGVKSNG